MRQVVGFGFVFHQAGKQAGGHHGDDGMHGVFGAVFVHQPYQQREHEVKLFFQRQRPDVQQWFFGRLNIEIAAALGKKQIGAEQQGGAQRTQIGNEIVGCQQPDAGSRTGGEHEQEGGQYAFGAALVEIQQREALLGQFALDDAGNQIAGNDEKNIHAEKAAGQQIGMDMKQDDGNNGNGAQPVNVGSVGKWVLDGMVVHFELM